MQENVRPIIGRLCSSSNSLKSIEYALGFGWVVSVDLLYGLPGQTLSGFIQGIEDLVKVGVNGFSLYELIIRQQNYQWAFRNNLVNRGHLENYLLVQAGASFLETHGYKKNFYNHWADKNDTNIYFTFPIRGEDCLAIGTVADGVFEDYHYRHPTYGKYSRGNLCNAPVLEGGLRKSQFERLLYPFETAIFSGCIEPEIVNKLNTIQEDTASLLHKWLVHKMFEQNLNGGLNLTTNGTWFAGNLFNELTNHFKNTL
jgi:oxygen-independent coproporphyrinogen-3 oxidase